MARLVIRRFSDADESFEADGVRTDTVDLGDLAIGYTVHQPGWRWSEHVRPIVGTQSCQIRHLGMVLSGRLGVRMESGEEAVIESGEAFSIPPGHDGWVEGDDPVVAIEWSGATEWLRPVGSRRVMATLVMTDIVDSTAELHRLGDHRWRALLGAHDEMVRTVVLGTEGREVKSTGDGFLIAYDGAARAVRAAQAIRSRVAELAIATRTAVHAGEVELVGNDVRGIAVHEVSRIMSAARPGEILVSDVTRLLASGSGLNLVARGRHRLKGIDDEVTLFALADVGAEDEDASGDAPLRFSEPREAE